MAVIDLYGYGMNVDVLEGVLPSDTIFLHGNLASNTWWEPSMAILKAKARPDYKGRAILAEWRGCGKSQAPNSEEELHPAAMAEDYIQLCDKLHIAKANLVAHSTGGIISLYAMLKKPELFERAVLLDTVGASGVQFGPEMYTAFTQMSQDRTMCETVMGGTILGNDPHSPLFKRIVDDAMGIAKINWHGVPHMLHVTDMTAELKNIRQPILILHGKQDPVIPLETAMTLAAGLPDARLEVLEHNGHSTNVENPELFVAKMTSFLFNLS